MLELRLTPDAKRISSMRELVLRECDRSKAGAEHAAEVALVIEQLVDAGEEQPGRRGLRARRRGDVFVVVTVQSDETMLMVRDTRDERGGLGERRQRLLEEHTSSWSTMVGPDGRTVWAEVPRAPRPEPEPVEPDVTRAVERSVLGQASSTRAPSRTIQYRRSSSPSVSLRTGGPVAG
jgi:hypothetical protein